MHRRAFCVFLCFLALLFLSPVARGEERSVRLGAAPDDYLLISLESENINRDFFQLNGLRYQPEKARADVIRVTTGDLTAALALTEAPALLADYGLSSKDVYLSLGKLWPYDGAAGKAYGPAAPVTPPNEADYLDTILQMEHRLQALLTGLRGADFADDPDVQATLDSLERLTNDGEALRQAVVVLYRHNRRMPDGEAQSVSQDSVELFIRTRLPDAARNALLWLDNGSFSGTEILKERLTSDPEISALRELLESVVSLDIPNTNAVQEKADLVNERISAISSAQLVGKRLTLSGGVGLNLSLSMEALLASPDGGGTAMSRERAELLNPAVSVKRLGMKNADTAHSDSGLSADASEAGK